MEVPMSDGPHRTLSMRRGWRHVAKCAGNDAYRPEEIGQWLLAALARDWHAEVPPKLVAVLSEALSDSHQTTLFVDDRRERIEAARLSNLLKKHTEEWTSFTGSPGAQSFMTHWLGGLA